MHKTIQKILVSFKKSGEKENAGSKMFAQKLLFLASTFTLILYLTNSSMIILPLFVIFMFSILEWSLGFCIACWTYNIFYQIKNKIS